MFRLLSRFLRLPARFRRATGGNVAVVFAIAALPLTAAAGMAVDYTRASGVQARLQKSLDASLIAGLRATGTEIATAGQVFTANFQLRDAGLSATTSYSLSGETLTGTAETTVTNAFGGLLKQDTTVIKVTGAALRTSSSSSSSSGPCIYVLDSTAYQALLVNSGAKINATDCEIHVHSTQNPAAIINSGTTLNVKRICIQGTNIIKNTSATLPIELGCQVTADPYAGKLPTPTVGSCTNTQQTYDPPASGAHSMAAGSTWCSVIFNGSPKIVFQPGLHIIKGTMIINSGSTVLAEGVTFYFADVWSGIQFNGGITSVMKAPTSGTYANILMFEASGGTNRSSLVFNSSVSEELSGLIYLPNRNVTYNATSTVTGSKVRMVFNTLILNNLDWRLTPGTSPTVSGSTTTSVRLTQ